MLPSKLYGPITGIGSKITAGMAEQKTAAATANVVTETVSHSTSVDNIYLPFAIFMYGQTTSDGVYC